MAIRMGGNSTLTNTSAVAFADGTQQTTVAAPLISPAFTGAVSFAGATLNLTSVALGGVYTGVITGGAGNAYAGGSFTVTGFTNGANNGVDLLVTGSTATTLTLVNPSTVVESHSASAVTTGVLKVAGSMLDNSGSPGSTGQVLLSTGPGMAWSDQSTLALGVNQVAGAAPTLSPTFTGNVTLPPFTATLGTSPIGAGTAATLVTVPVTGLTTSSVIHHTFATDPTGVVGYGTTGGLVVTAFPTAGNANFSVVNPTAGSITPGAMTLNFRTHN